ncbi:predicted protein [Uncinocarpus reesii 1704]|uniref:DNA-directed RNA polymerase subunit n=1 Tax=Uncinocarpus reesii (strain UAMH 1704) TaxID=336963 RepID=C4JKG6_UNCRE|nr:uncharacterized protein UREG_02123 [Uncinocarpus reesii 1704]EEP77274.1 predicted protein [Uncinocarpus reesii 1704]
MADIVAIASRGGFRPQKELGRQATRETLVSKRIVDQKKKICGQSSFHEGSWRSGTSMNATMETTSLSSPVKKRKNKDDDHKSSKKRKHLDDGPPSSPEQTKKDKHHRKNKSTDEPSRPSGSRKSHGKASASQLDSPDSSPFHLVTTTLYLPLSPISISPTHALPCLISEHVAPLLLTYYPPVKGIILAFSNPSISSTPPQSTSAAPQNNTNPQSLTLATTAGEYGVLYVYLTITLLVFRPERGQTLQGWINVQSEGFLGAVVLNLFSVGIERKRLPPDWKWIAPGQQPTAANQDEDEHGEGTFDPGSALDEDDAGRLLNEHDDEVSAAMGYFQTGSGKRIRGTIEFRVRDVDVIPGSERDKGFISLEGTMLSPEAEANLVSEEKRRIMGHQAGVIDVQANGDDVNMMSGGLVDEERGNEHTAGSTEKKKKKKKRSKE